MTQRVLFVCLGNICRSPTAEAVFASQIGSLDVSHDSAGTSGWHIGEPPYGLMIAAARRRGIEMDHLRARQFSAADFSEFDLIIGMDPANIEAIESLRPAGSNTRVALLLDFADGDEKTVPDPYYTRDFDGAIDLVGAGVQGLIKALSP